jgi:hypothetical protein
MTTTHKTLPASNCTQEQLDILAEFAETCPKTKAGLDNYDAFESVVCALPAVKQKKEKATKAPLKPTKEKAEKSPVTKPAGSPKKSGLRSAQVRILQLLSKSKAPKNRTEIAEGAPCDLAFCTEFLGSHDPEKREKNDTKQGGFPSLLTLKYIKLIEKIEETTSGTSKTVRTYEITATGRKVLESELKAAK